LSESTVLLAKLDDALRNDSAHPRQKCQLFSTGAVDVDLSIRCHHRHHSERQKRESKACSDSLFMCHVSFLLGLSGLIR
jgi:IS1 family transposase